MTGEQVPGGGGRGEKGGKRTAMLPERPAWLMDEAEVLALLNLFLDKLDKIPLSERARLPTVRLNKQLVPRLYRHDEAADRSWSLLRSLAGPVFEIRLDRKRAAFEPEYVGAALRFGEAAESICRAWLDRPRQLPYQQQWALAVAARCDRFADQGAALRARPVKVSGKSAQEVVDAFAGIANYCVANDSLSSDNIANDSSTNLTLRQLSARCFWGLSKLLDARADILVQLFPQLQIAPRPVLVHVHLPETSTPRALPGVLFIENQDSYVQALAGQPVAAQGLVLVYSAGFRGSAGRVRAHAGASLHYHAGGTPVARQCFENWWFAEQPAPWPVWFWGDLDYSGMAILKALRQRFGKVQAWSPGYAPLLQLLQNGVGHSPDSADKAEQLDPGITGCEYADQVLLPAIRRLGRFVDQEIL